MQRHLVKIGNQSFGLLDEADLQRVRNATIEAIQHGGDIIDIRTDTDASVAALIAPGIPVLFFSDTIQEDADNDTDEAGGLSFLAEGFDF